MHIFVVSGEVLFFIVASGRLFNASGVNLLCFFLLGWDLKLNAVNALGVFHAGVSLALDLDHGGVDAGQVALVQAPLLVEEARFPDAVAWGSLGAGPCIFFLSVAHMLLK